MVKLPLGRDQKSSSNAITPLFSERLTSLIQFLGSQNEQSICAFSRVLQKMNVFLLVDAVLLLLSNVVLTRSAADKTYLQRESRSVTAHKARQLKLTRPSLFCCEHQTPGVDGFVSDILSAVWTPVGIDGVIWEHE